MTRSVTWVLQSVESLHDLLNIETTDGMASMMVSELSDVLKPQLTPGGGGVLPNLKLSLIGRARGAVKPAAPVAATRGSRELTAVRLIPLTRSVCVPQAVGVAQISETLLIDQVVARLATPHADLPPDQVAGAVRSAHARFEQCPIREFVPLLVERRARAELSRNAGLLTVSI